MTLMIPSLDPAQILTGIQARIKNAFIYLRILKQGKCSYVAFTFHHITTPILLEPYGSWTWVGWKDPLMVHSDIKKWGQSHTSNTLINGPQVSRLFINRKKNWPLIQRFIRFGVCKPQCPMTIMWIPYIWTTWMDHEMGQLEVLTVIWREVNAFKHFPSNNMSDAYVVIVFVFSLQNFIFLSIHVLNFPY